MVFNQAMLSSIAKGFAILILLALFTIGIHPAIGYKFPGLRHVVVHISTFALITIAFGIGWRRLSVIMVFILASLIGTLDEISEIFTHHHPLEIKDILIDAGGAFVGILLLSLINRWLALR